MFDLGWSELFVIGLATLLVVGPKELPNVLRAVSGAMKKMRGMAREFQSSLDDMARDTELEDIRKEFKAVKGELDVNARMKEMMTPDDDKDYWALEDAEERFNERRMQELAAEELAAEEGRKAAVEAANKAAADYQPPSPQPDPETALASSQPDLAPDLDSKTARDPEQLTSGR